MTPGLVVVTGANATVKWSKSRQMHTLYTDVEEQGIIQNLSNDGDPGGMLPEIEQLCNSIFLDQQEKNHPHQNPALQ